MELNQIIAVVGFFIGILFTTGILLRCLFKKDILPVGIIGMALGWTMFVYGIYISKL